MSPAEITRAWKEPAFRDSLADQPSLDLPQHPAGRPPFEQLVRVLHLRMWCVDSSMLEAPAGLCTSDTGRFDQPCRSI